jgi:hypothetical protein
MTHTLTETREERFARLIQEAMEYGNGYIKNKTKEHNIAYHHLAVAHINAEADIRSKGGV